MKRRQILLTLFVLLLACTGAGLLALLAIDSYMARFGRRLLAESQQSPPPADQNIVIVPGAPYWPDGQPGLMLKDRLLSALQLVQSGQASHVLISGDSGSAVYDEISVMRRYLLEHGLAENALIIDPAGFDTYETLKRARDVYQIRQALITTQTYHLLRALYIGQKLGIQLYGITCDQRVYPHQTGHRLREVIARFKAFIQCEITRPKAMIEDKC